MNIDQAVTTANISSLYFSNMYDLCLFSFTIGAVRQAIINNEKPIYKDIFQDFNSAFQISVRDQLTYREMHARFKAMSEKMNGV